MNSNTLLRSGACFGVIAAFAGMPAIEAAAQRGVMAG